MVSVISDAYEQTQTTQIIFHRLARASPLRVCFNYSTLTLCSLASTLVFILHPVLSPY